MECVEQSDTRPFPEGRYGSIVAAGPKCFGAGHLHVYEQLEIFVQQMFTDADGLRQFAEYSMYFALFFRFQQGDFVARFHGFAGFEFSR